MRNYSFMKKAESKKEEKTNLPIILQNRQRSELKPVSFKKGTSYFDNRYSSKEYTMPNMNQAYKTERNNSKFGSELSIPQAKGRESSMISAHDYKLTMLNEITPLTALPKNHTRRLDINSPAIEKIFKCKAFGVEYFV